MTITDEMMQKAEDVFAAHPYGSYPRKDAIRATLEAIAPMLIAPYARGLLEIAELAMPDTYFQTDSRCVAARAILGIQELDPK